MTAPTKRTAPPGVLAAAADYPWRVIDTVPYSSHYHEVGVYRLTTDRGQKSLKPYRGKLVRLQHLSQNIRRLRRLGFHKMPVWLSTRSGRRWKRTQAGLFYATSWVHGHTLSPNRNDFQKDYYAFGFTLGELHAKTEGIPLQGRQVRGLRLAALRRQSMEFENLEQTKDVHEVGDWLRDHREACLELANRAWQTIDHGHVATAIRREARKPSWLHGDVTRPNVVMTEKGAWLIDWENMNSGSGLMELVKALANTTDYQVSCMQAMLDGYEHIRPLRPSQRRLAAALFCFPREAWMAANHMRSGRTHPSFSALRDSWEQRLGAVEWLHQWSRL